MRDAFRWNRRFNHDLGKWDVKSVANFKNMFFLTPFSSANKGSIHETFSQNENWSYDWAEHVPPRNLAPLAELRIHENMPTGSIVGKFNTTDANNGNITYSLVSGLGDENNSIFNLDTNGTLKTTTTFDYESNALKYSIRIRANDELNKYVESNFTVTLLNVVEDLDKDGTEDLFDLDIDGDGFSNAEEIAYGSNPWDAKSIANASPTDLALSNHTILENQPAGTIVGQLIGSDPDEKNTLNYSRVLGPGDQHNSYFVIDKNRTLRTQRFFDYESDDHNLSVRIRVRDEHNADPSVKVFSLDMNKPCSPIARQCSI